MIVTPAPKEPETIGTIDGMTPDSKEEWWVYLALKKYEVPYQYQFQIFGGTTRRGGLVVDFVVYNPDATPLEVNGKYWHRNEMDGGDKTSLYAIEDYFKKQALILWAGDGQTKDDVFNWVRKYVAK